MNDIGKGEIALLIRERRATDAEIFISLIKEVESQSAFMLMQTGDRKTTSEKQRKRLERIEKSRESTIFVAEIECAFVRYVMVMWGIVKRAKLSAYVVVGILE